MGLQIYCVLLMVVMEARLIYAQLSPSVPNTCLDTENGLWFCCNGYDQVGNMCVVWRCSNELHCSRGTCDTSTGKCICPPGWEGTKCELPCKFGKYGQDCRYECNCINGAECEPGNGNCVCLPGYIGNTCEQLCPRGTFGKYCREECDCLNGSPCSSVDGICICEPGLTGDRCQTCLPEKHLIQCFSYCNAICMNDGVCDTILKKCKCAVGYTGEHCEICNPNTHPLNCIPDCENTLCANGAMCDTKTRECDCTRGWRGRSCNAPCENDYYGRGCSEECNCIGMPCHHITGLCLSECPVGWWGDDCRQPCIEGSYGYMCTQTCDCQNGAQCDPETGNCICSAGFRGKNCEESCPTGRGGTNCEKCLCESPLVCDDEFNECVCLAGFTGLYCKQPCPEGNYGPSCYKQCSCRGNETCDAVSGVCNCESGWTGSACQSICLPGSFGPGCSLTCPKCPNLNGCFHVNGSCDMCDPGFKGESCDVICPRGFYGPGCLYTCTCNNGMCNPTNGACPLPYSQSPSTVGMDYVHDDERDSDFPLFIVISASTLSFLLILMLTILIGTRIYQKGYKHGSRSSKNVLTDVVSMNTANGNGRPYNARATVQTFTTSSDSGLCEYSTHLHEDGDTPDIIASNSYSIDPDESSYTEVEINLCQSTNSFNEYMYTTPPALPAQNPCQTPSSDEKKVDFYDEAYSSIEKQDSDKMDDLDVNCYDFLSDAQTLAKDPAEPNPVPQHQYYVLEPTPPENDDDDDYDNISEGESDACLPVPNNYEDITIIRPGPPQDSETYEEVTNPLVHHHTLDAIGKNKKKNVYDLLGNSAKRRKRIGSEGNKLSGNNSTGNYGRLHKENKAQSGYNELEFGPKTVRVGKTVFPTGNYYGSLNR